MIGIFCEAAGKPITDVVAICELESDDGYKKWSKAEGGTLVIEFEDGTSLTMTQPLGREIVQITAMSVAGAIMNSKADVPDEEFAAVSLFDLFCFRCDSSDRGPVLTEITGFFREGDSENILGLTISLSTGNLIGIDASSYGGLTWFLDGHLTSFRNGYSNLCGLTERLIWKQE